MRSELVGQKVSCHPKLFCLNPSNESATESVSVTVLSHDSQNKDKENIVYNKEILQYKERSLNAMS